MTDAFLALLGAHALPTAKAAHARAAAAARLDGAPSAWAGLLEDVGWQWFATLTFRESVHPEAAESGYNKWCSHLSTVARAPFAWACAWEMQRRGTLHAHALLVGLPPRWTSGADCRLAAMKLWESSHPNHGIARIERFDPGEGAGGYLGKYVAKGGAIDLGVAVPLIRAPRRGGSRGGKREARASVATGRAYGREVLRALMRR